MIRDTYVMRDGKLVPKRLAARRDVPARVHITSDTMEPLRHMVTGEILDSKSAFRARTRAAGCEEVGNERAASRARPTDLTPVELDIKRAIAELKSR
jgi:hypothetical protein